MNIYSITKTLYKTMSYILQKYELYTKSRLLQGNGSFRVSCVQHQENRVFE